MAKVTGLGHFGVYVSDMDKMVDFYTHVMGMTLTDRMGDRISFLSARPEEEHHELALAGDPAQKTEAGQISFHVDTLQDLKAMHQKLVDYGIDSFRNVNHGIAFGSYFEDPEGNRVEVYWSTGIDYPQPFAEPIDLGASDEDLLKGLEQLPPREGSGPHYYGLDAGKRLRSAPLKN